MDILLQIPRHLLRVSPKTTVTSECRFPRQGENRKCFESIHSKYCMITTGKVQKHAADKNVYLPTRKKRKKIKKEWPLNLKLLLLLIYKLYLKSFQQYSIKKKVIKQFDPYIFKMLLLFSLEKKATHLYLPFVTMLLRFISGFKSLLHVKQKFLLAPSVQWWLSLHLLVLCAHFPHRQQSYTMTLHFIKKKSRLIWILYESSCL